MVGCKITMVFDDVLFQITDQGSDSRNLGWWSYITFTEKNGIKSTIFTCYCQCKRSLVGSAYAQQLVYMAEHGDKLLNNTTCLKQLFGKDLNVTPLTICVASSSPGESYF